MAVTTTNIAPTVTDPYALIAASIHQSATTLPPELPKICAEYTFQRPEDTARYGTFFDLPKHEQTLLRTSTALDCRGNNQLTWHDVVAIGQFAPQLRYLDLRECAHFQRPDLAQLIPQQLDLQKATDLAAVWMHMAFCRHQSVVIQFSDTLAFHFHTPQIDGSLVPKEDNYAIATLGSGATISPPTHHERGHSGGFDATALAPYRLPADAPSYTTFIPNTLLIPRVAAVATAVLAHFRGQMQAARQLT